MTTARVTELTDRELDRLSTLGKASLVKAFDDSGDLVGQALINLVDGTFAIEKTMFRIQPQTSFFGRIKLRVSVNDVAQVRNDELGLGMW